MSSARRSAKAEVRGANPRESTIPTRNAECGMRNDAAQLFCSILRSTFRTPRFNCPPCLKQLQGGFRKPVFVGARPVRWWHRLAAIPPAWLSHGASPTRGSILRSEPMCGVSERRMPFIASGRRRAFSHGSELWMAGHSDGDHDVTAASRPVKAFVPVRIRLVTPISRMECTASAQ
jgi:hypothetical protein